MGEEKKSGGGKGCLVALAVLVLLVVAFLYARSRISRPYRAAREQYEATDAQFPFAATSDTRLSSEQLADYVAIRAGILPHVRGFVTAIDAGRAEKAQGRGGLGLAAKMAKQMAQLSTQLAEAHASLLKEHEMSINEYRWIGKRAFACLHHKTKTDPPADRSAWQSVEKGFVSGAPRIAKYRANPPKLVSRLGLDAVQPDSSEIELVLGRLSECFEPHHLLYQEVALVLQGEGKGK